MEYLGAGGVFRDLTGRGGLMVGATVKDPTDSCSAELFLTKKKKRNRNNAGEKKRKKET